MHGILPLTKDATSRKRIADYYKAGVSVEQLRRRYRVSDNTIRKILDDMKIQRRPGGGTEWV